MTSFRPLTLLLQWCSLVMEGYMNGFYCWQAFEMYQRGHNNCEGRQLQSSVVLVIDLDAWLYMKVLNCLCLQILRGPFVAFSCSK